MKITFLGTGSSQGVPIIACKCQVCQAPDAKDKRLRSSIHFTTKGKSMIIDPGPDLRQQVLRERISSLDVLLFTHGHRDHTGGLGEVKSFFGKGQKIAIYGAAQVIQRLQQEYAYLFEAPCYAGAPKFDIHTIEGTPFMLFDDLTVIPIYVYHDRLPIWGFRLGELTYITDAKVIAEEEIKKIQKTTVLIVNALQQEPHHAHFSLQEAIVLAKKVNAKMTYLTHIGHQMGLHDEVSKTLPKNIQLAYDGLKISL